MAYLVRWWLLIELLGLLALPLCARLFPRLPDRGYAFSKVFGLLLVCYVAWMGGVSGLLPFSAGSLLLAVLLLALLGIAFARGVLPGLRADWACLRRYVLWSELVFVVALLAVALLRSYSPAIAGTEKPFEYANLTAVSRTQTFAPTDPWMSGRPDAYYYFGYVVGDGTAQLTGTPPRYAFNIALVLIAGLTAFTAFGLTANAAAMFKESDIANAWPLAAGVLGVVLIMVIGNLEGVLELGAVHGWDPGWVYQHLDISGLQPRASLHWFPTEAGFGSWWRATRLGSDWNFLEFPFFSFLLGDLHPHVLSLPFKLLSAGFALGLTVTPSLPRPGAWRQGLPYLGASALALGASLAVHPWDFPAFALLFAIVLLWRYRRELASLEALAARAAVAGGVAVLGAMLLFVPYLLSGGSGAIKGIQPTEPYFIWQQSQGSVPTEATYLPFQHFLLFWTPLMLPAAVFVTWALARRGWRAVAAYGPGALGAVALLPATWAVTVWVRHGSDGLADELRVRGEGWLTVVVLGLLLAATLAALYDELRVAGEPAAAVESAELTVRAAAGPIVFLLAAIVVALLLVYGPELFMVRDSSGTRANSTFKLWYSAWALLSVAGAAGGAWALWEARPRSMPLGLVRPLALAACGLVLTASLVYTVDAWANRAYQESGGRTLDGLAYLQQSDPDEYNAMSWLNGNVPGVQTVLQAVGQSYQENFSRISSRTGLPTLVEWPFHEQQLRGNDPAIERREADVQTIYQTPDQTVAFQLLARYGVQYVVIGQPERQEYGQAGMTKFAAMGTPVFTSATVVIYRVGKPPLFGALG